MGNHITEMELGDIQKKVDELLSTLHEFDTTLDSLRLEANMVHALCACIRELQKEIEAIEFVAGLRRQTKPEKIVSPNEIKILLNVHHVSNDDLTA